MTSWLPLLAVLACPIAMVAMMAFGMRRGKRSRDEGEGL